MVNDVGRRISEEMQAVGKEKGRYEKDEERKGGEP